MENKEIIENQKLANLSKQFEKLAKDQAIISAAIQYKKSQEIIDQKLKNENAAISYGIKRINKKVIENLNKYEEVEKEYQEIIEKYKSDLEELAKYHDTQIALGYAKILEEELKQKDIYIQLYHARKEEIIYKAKQKLIGFVLLSLSIASPLLIQDATVSVIMLPLGLYLLFTKEKAIM